MKQFLVIGVAVVVGAALVGAALFVGQQTQREGVTSQTINPFRVSDQRLFGNPNAAITIVEFSDIECPFCARVHPTIERLVDESNGTVNWEYRHLPLPMHRNAEFGALVAECVGDISGNDAFWQYLDVVFTNQSQITRSYLTKAAAAFDITPADIAACEADPKIVERLAADAATAAKLGGSGTPYSVVVFPNGLMRPVSGALPYEQWVSLLQQ